MWINEIMQTLLGILGGQKCVYSEFILDGWEYYLQVGGADGKIQYFVVFKAGYGSIVPLYKYESGREVLCNILADKDAVADHLMAKKQ